MKELVVISGKGGTGKTSLVASLAVLADNKVLADCDVDAADLHLVLEPDIESTETFIGGKIARIDPERCTGCGRCAELCRFDAIDVDQRNENGTALTYRVDPISCDGCSVCVEFCPADAIEFNDCISGEWFVSTTRCGPMVHAKLGIAEANSGKLVTMVRSRAREICEQRGFGLIIVDGPPGTGCPVIASVTGTDLAMVVTEPTTSGFHDLERVAALANHFSIPISVCINKWDLNRDVSDEIEQWCKDNGVRVLGKLPYDREFTHAQVAGKSLIDHNPSGKTADAVRHIWQEIQRILDGENQTEQP
ncbi:MAG: ATP-binding protein [Candidatus Hydrogenedentes bacterium]|nr:ATP-binding protein [Candidatus Hydrogenedentota bacterium]